MIYVFLTNLNRYFMVAGCLKEKPIVGEHPANQIESFSQKGGRAMKKFVWVVMIVLFSVSFVFNASAAKPFKIAAIFQTAIE